ncbi:MAG TPA: putative glycoside hydrolase [Candidatus Eubacterium faecavium]|nr:putative glycoside hydrolase [Candidatus Eubacterium faecavium]
MKKKRFYKNVKRNLKWTEEEKGYPIDFADKYLSDEGVYTDKFDYMRPKVKKKRKHKARARTFLKRAGITLLCLLIIGVGYTAMDVFMMRNGMPVRYSDIEPDTQSSINEMKLDLQCAFEESISMDGSVILDSVITELTQGAYNSVMFDIKREDGTIGYQSALATVDTYSAVSLAASDLKTSAQKLNEQDILAVGRVYCYLDNLVPARDRSAALLDSNGLPYTDSQGNTYLNPNSETVYKYIKDVIAEAADMGVTVFVLEGTDIPESAGEGYADGFETLAARLYEDIGTDIKLLEAVHINADDALRSSVQEETTAGEEAQEKEEETAQAAENITAAVAELFSEELSTDRVYYVTTSLDIGEVKTILEESGIESFILANESL